MATDLVKVGTRIPPERHEDLQRIAKEMSTELGFPVSVAQLIRGAITKYIEVRDDLTWQMTGEEFVETKKAASTRLETLDSRLRRRASESLPSG